MTRLLASILRQCADRLDPPKPTVSFRFAEGNYVTTAANGNTGHSVTYNLRSV